MTKMDAMPIYGKNPLKIFFSGTGRPLSDLDLFYGRVKFGYLGFFMGKSETVDFSETIEASDLKGW